MLDNSPLAPIVQMHDVVKIYRGEHVGVHAINGISLEIPARRLAMIVGPSGSGKTTLLNLIGCIDRPSAGSIEVCGQDVSRLGDNSLTDFRARNIAFVFQDFNLFPVLSAYENVEYPLLLIGMPKKDRHERTMAMLDAVDLSDHKDHRPNQLSGGQQQRVAIARALVKHPQIVLADEPTANLDSRNGAHIIDLMHKVQREEQVSFVICSHDPKLISEAEETFAIRDGRLVKDLDDADR